MAANREKIKDIIITVVAIAIGIVLFTLFWKNQTRDLRKASPEIVIMGDSIFAGTRGEDSVSTKLSARLGREITDVSIGGSCLGYLDRDARLDYYDDAVSMAALTQAVLSNDFRYQENANIKSAATSYLGERLQTLEAIDFSEVKILIIDHLLNDYHSGIQIRTDGDKYDEYTYEGALRSIVTQLKDSYPELRIILVAPTLSWYGDEETDYSTGYFYPRGNILPSSEYDFGRGSITEYIEVQKMVAEELGVEWISMYDLYSKAADAAQETDDLAEEGRLYACYKYTIDGIHPNGNGIELITDFLYNYLKS